jgi:hypothetical protein
MASRVRIERLDEGIRAIDRVSNDRGVDLVAFRRGIIAAIAALRGQGAFEWPSVTFKAPAR